MNRKFDIEVPADVLRKIQVFWVMTSVICRLVPEVSKVCSAYFFTVKQSFLLDFMTMKMKAL